MDATLAVRMRPYELAPMHPEDIESVLEVEHGIYAFPWTRGNFEDSLASGYTAWLMRDGKQLLGYAVMMGILDEAHLLNITIISGQQRGGLGSLLLQSLCEEAKSHGAVRMLLEVRESNIVGRAFYRRHGFTQIGERTDYYPAKQGREPALVLEKRI